MMQNPQVTRGVVSFQTGARRDEADGRGLPFSAFAVNPCDNELT